MLWHRRRLAGSLFLAWAVAQVALLVVNCWVAYDWQHRTEVPPSDWVPVVEWLYWAIRTSNVLGLISFVVAMLRFGGHGA